MRRFGQKGAPSNAKIIAFLIIFGVWAGMIGFGKAIILFTDQNTTGGDTFLECTYFNGFVLKAIDLRELKSASDPNTCPFMIENSELGAWVPL